MKRRRGKVRTGDSSNSDNYNSKKDEASVVEIASLLLSAIYDGVAVAA